MKCICTPIITIAYLIVIIFIFILASDTIKKNNLQKSYISTNQLIYDLTRSKSYGNSQYEISNCVVNFVGDIANYPTCFNVFNQNITKGNCVDIYLRLCDYYELTFVDLSLIKGFAVNKTKYLIYNFNTTCELKNNECFESFYSKVLDFKAVLFDPKNPNIYIIGNSYGGGDGMLLFIGMLCIVLFIILLFLSVKYCYQYYKNIQFNGTINHMANEQNMEMPHV